MYKRYRERRRRRNGSENRSRSVWTRPSVQLTIVLIAALIVFIILSTNR